MIKTIRIVIGLLRMAHRPTDSARVAGFREILRDYGYFDSGVRRVLSAESTRSIMSTKPLLDWGENDMSRLRELPPSTLGYQIAAFLDHNGLKVLSYKKDSNLTDVEYFLRRVLQTHDIWHAVLGYDTDFLGELAISAFMLAQIDWPSGGFYISAYLLRTMIKNPSEAPAVIRAVAGGWARGVAAPPFFAVRWEDHLERPLADLRSELGITLSAG